MIGIDCIGPLPRTKRGNRYVILATDYATNWTEGIAVKQKTAQNVVKFLVKEVFCRHGPPIEIRADMGREFTAGIVKEVAK